MPIDLPVVLARGLWSNLSTWQVLASELANEGRDAWLIEITGGPGQDCDTCPDYTFDDLTDDYVPSLLNGVLTFTGKDKIQYVGFSNGCRATLSSLEKDKFDPTKVETFVGVGCPGTFEGFNPIASGIELAGDRITKNLENKNKTHITIRGMFIAGILNFNYLSQEETEKISLNLWKQYHNWMNSTNDSQPGNFNIANFAIIQGNALITSDGIVSSADEKAIYSSINLTEPSVNQTNIKRYLNIFATHIGLPDKDRTKSIVSKIINKQDLNWWENNINLKEYYERSS